MAASTKTGLSRGVGLLAVGWACVLVGVMFGRDVRAWLAPPPAERDLFASGEMRVGLDPSRPPFAFFDADGGYAGIEIDLARELGVAFGVEVVLVPLGFDGLYDALQTNQVDVVIAGLQPDFGAARRGVVYSRHYFDAGLVLVGPDAIGGMTDLPGYALAYEFGSVADALAHRWLRRVRPFELRPYQLPIHTLQAVEYGEADVALVDAVTARRYLRDSPALMAGSPVSVTHAWYTVTIREGRGELLRAVNDTLNDLDDTGRLEALVGAWL
jgi:ABC-type amino acid transport substrate-binding protein